MTEQTSQEMPQTKRYPAQYYATEREMRDLSLRFAPLSARRNEGHRTVGFFSNPAARLQSSN